MNGNLDRALAKIHRFGDYSKKYNQNSREWCGCLTPSEIFALIDEGAQPVASEANTMPFIRKDIEEGQANTRWFYFYLSSKLKTLLGKRYDKEGNPHGKARS